MTQLHLPLLPALAAVNFLQVAVKVLSVDSPDVYRQFVQEVELSSQLRWGADTNRPSLYDLFNCWVGAQHGGVRGQIRAHPAVLTGTMNASYSHMTSP